MIPIPTFSGDKAVSADCRCLEQFGPGTVPLVTGLHNRGLSMSLLLAGYKVKYSSYMATAEAPQQYPRLPSTADCDVKLISIDSGKRNNTRVSANH